MQFQSFSEGVHCRDGAEVTSTCRSSAILQLYSETKLATYKVNGYYLVTKLASAKAV